MNTSIKKAVVVAHPDDETLWAGGLILRNPGITVICCSTPRRDPIRAEKFVDACHAMGAKPRIIMVEESDPASPLPGLALLDLEEFDHIITHNRFGEYGHLHHIQVHDFVSKNYQHKSLSFFGFRPNGGAGRQILSLTPEERSKKLAALQCYDHVSPSDNMPKWMGLLNRYFPIGGEQKIEVESYDGDEV